MNPQHLLLPLALVFLAASPMEFFYTIPRRQYHCFEENLADQILVTGQISYAFNGPIDFKVISPERREITRKVRNSSIQ